MPVVSISFPTSLFILHFDISSCLGGGLSVYHERREGVGCRRLFVVVARSQCSPSIFFFLFRTPSAPDLPNTPDPPDTSDTHVLLHLYGLHRYDGYTVRCGDGENRYTARGNHDRTCLDAYGDRIDPTRWTHRRDCHQGRCQDTLERKEGSVNLY